MEQRKDEAKSTSIMDRVVDYASACKELGREPLTQDHFNFLPESQRVTAWGHHKVMTACEALNEGWYPDWDNSSQWKHYPYFDMETYEGTPGSGFAFRVVHFDRGSTYLGARLYFKTEELAEHAGKTFLEDYRLWMKG